MAKEATMNTKAINHNHRYENTNGGIYCYKHVGASAQATIDNSPSIKAFQTDLTSWVRLTNKEIAEFANLINNDETCEDCRYSALRSA
jgi:non-homologous end joining protein Ku